MVYRIYIEKKAEYAVEADSIFNDLKKTLGLKGLRSLRLFNRYDIEGVDRETFIKARDIIFSEPPVDVYYTDFPISEKDAEIFAVEYLAAFSYTHLDVYKRQE